MERVNLNTAGVGRSYLFARPPSPGVCPVVVMLHGTGGTAAWCEGETGLGAACLARGFAIALPDGLPIHPAREPKFLTNPARWNDGSTRPGDALHTDAADVEFLAAVVADLAARGCDARRVLVTGFSNGAGMSFRFAAERAELLAAVAPVAGYCWTDAKPSRPVPTLYLVGLADPLVPWGGGAVRLPWGGRTVVRASVPETLAKWAAANGQAPTLLTVEGLGHHWPGGRGQLHPKIGGPPDGPVSANSELLRFFEAVPPTPHREL